MPGNGHHDVPVLSQLLLRWETAYQQGRDIPAAELCAEQPALVADLDCAIGALRRMNQFLHAVDQHPEPPLSDDIPPTIGDVVGTPFSALPTLAPPWAGNSATAPPVDSPPRHPLRPIPGYRIIEELGRGGMGVVYKARQLGLNRLVALKMILAGQHAGIAALARFRTEAEAIARLQHPNIVQVFEVGEWDGIAFFSLEYCGGGSLDRQLQGTPLPPEQAAALVETLARAVQVAHQQGIVHRDLKPGNVLLALPSPPNPRRAPSRP